MSKLKPFGPFTKQLKCGCLVDPTDGSKVPCQKHTSKKLRKLIDESYAMAD